MRPSLEKWALEIACVTAKRSTCGRAAVGCVLLDVNGKVLATGYNGVPKSFTHCTDKPCRGLNVESNADDCVATHAEINALMQCSDVTKVHIVACTTLPCFRCMKALLNTGMKKLAFIHTHPEKNKVLTLVNTRPFDMYKVTYTQYQPENFYGLV